MSRLLTLYRSRSAPVRGLIGVGAIVAIAFVGYRLIQYFNAEQHFRLAQQAAESEQFAVSQEHLAVCLKEWPKSSEVLYLMGRVCRRDGKFTEAKQYLKQAEDAGWPTESIAREKTLLRAMNGEFRLLEPMILLWAAADPPDWVVYYEVLVPGYLSDGRLEEADAVLTKWATREPNKLQIRIWQADACERMDRIPDAITASKLAAEIAPERDDVRIRCGMLLMNKHQPVDALPHFEAVLARNPQSQEGRFGLARCRYEMSDSKDATKIMEQLHREGYQQPDALRFGGKLALAANEVEQAERLLKKSLELAPAEPETLHLLAQVYQLQGRTAEAEATLARFKQILVDLKTLGDTVRNIAKNPNDVELRYQAGMLMVRNGLTAQGIRWLESALAQKPDHQPSRQALAEAGRIKRK